MAGSAGRPERSNQTVSAIVAPSPATSANHVHTTRKLELGCGAEEEREEEQVGDAEIRRAVLARHGERVGEHREDVLVVRDDLLGRPAPDRVRVDPRDHDRDEHDPRELLEVAKEPPAEEGGGGEAGEVRRDVRAERRQHCRQHGEGQTDRQQPCRICRSGSASSTSANVAGISTQAIHATFHQSPACHRRYARSS